VLQFALGHKIGERYSDRVTAGQSFGQKNTMFLIWVAYTFMNPVTSLAGGLYSIWHNLYNSWQLYRERNHEA
jgi:BASS family bile acid:Na+ symporter